MTTEIITIPEKKISTDNEELFFNTQFNFIYKAWIEKDNLFCTSFTLDVSTKINGNGGTQIAVYAVSSEEIMKLAESLTKLANEVKEYEEALRVAGVL